MTYPTTGRSICDANVIPFPPGGRDACANPATLVARLYTLHDEAAKHFCKAVERFIEIWQDENGDASVSDPSLRKGCCRLQMAEELSRLESFCKSHTAREEQVLRTAGMRRFPRAWAAHKISHARFLQRIERRVRHSGQESPGQLARNVALLLEDYWAAHNFGHDQLALSLLALLANGRGAPATAGAAQRMGGV